jgi:hypothetical protein
MSKTGTDSSFFAAGEMRQTRTRRRLFQPPLLRARPNLLDQPVQATKSAMRLPKAQFQLATRVAENNSAAKIARHGTSIRPIDVALMLRVLG